MNIERNGLTWEIFDSIRRYADMQIYEKTDIIEALKNTLYSVVIYDREKPVAIGRIVGDGRIAFFIKDVVVHPDYRNKHVGTMVVNELLDYIESCCCENPYIGLMAMPHTEKFYEKFGFIVRPNDRFGAGMICLNRRKV
ncbi:GNAT family N-acetyltransferase [Clostridium sp. YIM B02515]|uniref:GNAT family N-acetyltransferase n=1 Tax=Clostridium rhizosphaerae TaxID=2803861 RepID=A0ABS1T4Y4_9CLOT|nr:GNAT family N-acetyltransferase [Clostridium rhizosphaerae]MBL4934389.1 GNAT family N-acetyltransferase [Clostridium rhizosphaerae]